VANQHDVKGMVSEFYTTAAVTGAKDRILSDITMLNLDNFVRPVARQIPFENKFKNEVNDIFIGLLLQFIDEKGLGEQLLVYVSNSIEMLPMMKVEKSDKTMLLNRLDRMEVAIVLYVTALTVNPHVASNVNPHVALNAPVRPSIVNIPPPINETQC